MVDDVHRQALAYIQSHHVLTLATVGTEGVWAAAVFYASAAFDFYFLSAGHTRHAQDMRAQPRIAATIQEDYADWQAIQGIQLEGEVELLHGTERDTAVALYRRKFPFLQQPIPQIKIALTKVNWYKLKPARLYFIDNSKGFGHRDEVRLP